MRAEIVPSIIAVRECSRHASSSKFCSPRLNLVNFTTNCYRNRVKSQILNSLKNSKISNCTQVSITLYYPPKTFISPGISASQSSFENINSAEPAYIPSLTPSSNLRSQRPIPALKRISLIFNSPGRSARLKLLFSITRRCSRFKIFISAATLAEESAQRLSRLIILIVPSQSLFYLSLYGRAEFLQAALEDERQVYRPRGLRARPLRNDCEPAIDARVRQTLSISIPREKSGARPEISTIPRGYSTIGAALSSIEPGSGGGGRERGAGKPRRRVSRQAFCSVLLCGVLSLALLLSRFSELDFFSGTFAKSSYLHLYN